MLLLGGGRRGFHGSEAAYRGMFRLLSEEHIPFGVVDNLDWIGKRDGRSGDRDRRSAARSLQPYVATGGHLIVASSTAPPFDMGKVVKLWKDPDGAYFRIRDKAMFPSLKSIDVTFLYGDYLEVDAKGPLTLHSALDVRPAGTGTRGLEGHRRARA